MLDIVPVPPDAQFFLKKTQFRPIDADIKLLIVSTKFLSNSTMIFMLFYRKFSLVDNNMDFVTLV